MARTVGVCEDHADGFARRCPNHVAVCGAALEHAHFDFLDVGRGAQHQIRVPVLHQSLGLHLQDEHPGAQRWQLEAAVDVGGRAGERWRSKAECPSRAVAAAPLFVAILRGGSLGELNLNVCACHGGAVRAMHDAAQNRAAFD